MTPDPALLAQHADFLVVAKPAHLLSHPTRPDGKPTLLGWLREKFPGSFVALVSRLDRETSGVVLVARSAETASQLGAMTMRREIRKSYLALVSGLVAAEHGVIDAPLGRLGLSEHNPIWLRMGVISPDDTRGRKSAEARTEFWRLAAGAPGDADPVSLLRLQAHTGRLHQLRVHLAHLGHSVIGDKIYGPDFRLYLKFIADGWTDEHQRVLGFSRHALHAHELRFPWSGEELAFTAPLPEDMRELAARFSVSHPALLQESAPIGPTFSSPGPALAD